jgi:hypothetical protein
MFSFGLLGCSITPSTTPIAADPLARPLPLVFKNSLLQEKLQKHQLLDSFTTFWNHYAQRKWSERYDMERLPQNLSRDVYVSYYKPAAVIKIFEVTEVEPDEKGRVRIQLRVEFESKDDPAKTHSFSLPDWWEADESGQWKHLNHDPFLSKPRTSP